MNNEELIHFAIEARNNAISPTGYYVGAAILTQTGTVYTGCNLGSEDGLYNICAERTAIVKMLSEGKQKITKIAVVGGKQGELILTTPCGICRQLLIELAPEAEVICAYEENGKINYQVYMVKDLLPHGYTM